MLSNKKLSRRWPFSQCLQNFMESLRGTPARARRKSSWRGAHAAEILEDRALLADVTIALHGSNLRVDGSGEADELAIYLDDGDVVAKGLNGTTINGVADQFVVVPDANAIPNNLDVKLKDGDDILVLGHGLNVGHNLRIRTGDGNDRVGMFDVVVGHNLDIQTKDGNDTVVIHETHVQHNVSIKTGRGNDFAGLCQLEVDHNLSVYGGDGRFSENADDTFVAVEIVVDGKTKLRSGAGDDAILLIDSAVQKLQAHTGKGSDLLFADSNSFDGKFDAKLENDDDFAVFVNANEFLSDFKLDGGNHVDGDEIHDDESNLFDGKTKITKFELDTIPTASFAPRVDAALASLSDAKLSLGNFLNDSPDAVDDNYATDENSVLSVSLTTPPPALLANDSDPNGDPLTIVAVDGAAADVGTQVTLASGAFLTVNADGTFAYDPNDQFETLADGESLIDSFEYTVSDDGNAVDTATVTIAVTGVNDAPVLSAIDNQTVDELSVLTLTVAGSDVDGSDILNYSLDPTDTPSGATIDSATGVFTWTPTEEQGPGTFTATAIVTDSGTPALSNSQQFTITVNETNTPPVLDSISNQTIGEGTTLSFAASASDTDVPANELSFALDPNDMPVGATIDAATGTFMWTPTEAQGPGIYTATVVVSDDGTPTLTDSQQFTITVDEVNLPPELDVINDLTVEEFELLSINVRATDPDSPSNVLTYSLDPTDTPAGASINSSTGLLTWVPTESQGPGTYTVTVIVTDDGTPALSDSQQISITVTEVNTAPVLDLTGDQTVDEESPLSFTVTATDGDLPPNTLTYTLDANAAPVGAAIDSVTGEFTWTPTEGHGPGTFSATIMVTDNGTPALSDSQQVTITVNEVNAAPVLDTIADQTIDEGRQAAFTATATDADIPGNTLTFSLDPGDTPVGASIDAATGRFTWTPTANQAPGTFTTTVIVTDNGAPALFDSQQLTITVIEVNKAPVLNAIGDQTTDEETTLTFTVSATDEDLPAETLTYSLDSGFPAGALIDPQSGEFTWTPNEAQGPGFFPMTVRVTDAGGKTDSETLNITVDEVNQPPVLSPIGDQLAEEGFELSFTASADDTDAPGNELVFSLDAGAPSGVAIDPVTGAFTWIPTAAQGPATYDITVRVTDNGSPAFDDFETFTIGVTESAAFLQEDDDLVQQVMVPVDLGQVEGTRTLRVELDPSFDRTDTSPAIEDVFLIYLVDSTDSTTTLLDRGQNGTALFSLAGNDADFVPGNVRFDGRTVEIDVTGLGALTNGNLLFQLINSDADVGTEIRVVAVDSVLDPEGTVGPAFPLSPNIVNAGPAVDLNGFSVAADVDLSVNNVRLDASTGRYSAEVHLQNAGDAIGRQAVAVFTGLPAGVTLLNASGTDATGNPYLNFSSAIPAGGLAGGQSSSVLEIAFESPSLTQFAITPTILAAGPNQAPLLAPIPAQTVNPGGYLELQLNASDPDGDNITYQIQSDTPLPTGTLRGDRIIFSPVESEIGAYTFDVLATDGAAKASQTVTLTVVPDPVTTTRVSGVVLDTNELPLAGIPVEIGPLQAVTAADGSFQIEATGPLPSDTLVVRAEQFVGSESYPFIAEKMSLLFGRDPIDNVNNVIARPIYLPALDVANAQTIDPSQNTTVTVSLATGEAPAEVFVAAGTLEDQQGNLYSDDLSITEVPRDLTPAALPDGVFPDTVVTIQPGEMVFTTPAPLTLPNRAGLPAGTELQLWSINPLTGDFDNVGTGVVSTSGDLVETISGGIRNSSWHFFVTAGTSSSGSDNNQEGKCGCSKQEDSAESSSRVELHSGALVEEHDLVSYQSMGSTRSTTLRYDSERTDTRPILHFGYEDVVDDSSLRLIANLSVSAGNFTFEVPGASASNLGLSENEHFWRIPAGGGDIEAALQVDLRAQPTGIYNYTLRSGLLPQTTIAGGQTLLTGTRTTTIGRFLHVNQTESPFGAGWAMAGLQQVFEADDGALMHVDGNGFALLYLPPTSSGQPYQGPSGDFSTFEKLPNGTFRRTMRNQTVYQFDQQGRLSTMTDRNGNQTQYVYGANDQLERIIDPANLETLFVYTGDRVTSITDPANRITSLEYDAEGNLIRITDPDNSTRTFRYDDAHRMIGETDKRGFEESSEYNFAGRVVKANLKDGSEVFFDPAQTQALLPPDVTSNTENPPDAFRTTPVEAFFTDANGDVKRNTLDSAGQRVDSTDEFGMISSVDRDSNNRVTQSADGRGNLTTFQYDTNGNVIEIRDELSVIDVPLPTPFPGQVFEANPGSGMSGVAALHDVNADGLPDLILPDSNTVTVRLADGNDRFAQPASFAFTFGSGGVRQFAFGDVNNDTHEDIFVLGLESAVLPGNGDGTFGAKLFVSLPIGTDSVDLGDVTGDGIPDLLTSSFNVSISSSARTTIYEGDGVGGFSFHSEFNAPSTIGDARFADVDGDGNLDIVSLQRRQPILGINSAVRVRMGDGTGNFGGVQTFGVRNNPVSVAVGDLNSDTIPDIVTANDSDMSLSVLFGIGDGTFVSQPRIVLTDNPVFVGIADMTDDGVADLLATFQGGGVAILPGNGDGTFSSPMETLTGSTTVEPAIGDTNDDGKLDIVLGNSSQNVVLLNGLGTGGFAGQFDYNLGQTARAAAVGDTDGDRIPDIITANDNGTISVLPGVGDGTFLANIDVAIATDSRGVVATDVNGDGFDDIIATNRNADSISVLISNGDGTFVAQVQHPVGDSPRPIVSEDVNADGHVDLVLLNFTDNSITTMLGDGTGSFTRLDHALTNDNPRDLAIGDLNGNGNLDLVVTSGGNSIFSTNGKVSILEGAGDGTWTHNPANDKPTNRTPRNVELVDFDGDEILDAVTINSEQIFVFPGTGDGTFGTPVDIVPDGITSTVTTGDVSGDGNPDILVGTGLNSVLIYEGDGQLGFNQTGAYATASLAHGVVTADFDGNRQLDFVAFSVDNTSLDSHFVSPRLQNATTLGVQEVARTFTYDATFNQVTSETDELGRQTLFTIDSANGNVLTSTRVVGDTGGPDDLVTSFTYTSNGQVDTITDPLNRITDFDYDALGRLITTTVAKGTADQGVTQFEYDTAGNLTASIDENNNRTEFEYDAHNRLTLTRDALLNETSFTYDAVGNLITTTDARNNETTSTYDEMNRLIATVDELNLKTSFTYDNLGNLLSTIDPLGNTTTNRYDSRDRLTATIDPDGGVTAFRYDADDNLRVVTDPVSNVTTFVHDARDRVIREIDPLGNSTFFTYDLADNLIEKLDRNERVTEFTYDDLDRLTNELWVNADGTIANEIINTYDKAGNLLTAVDNFSALTFTYDNRDRVLTTDNVGTPQAPNVVLTYTYDAVGNVLSVTDTIEEVAGGTTMYDYDALNRVEQIRQFGNNVSDKRVDFTYNELGQYATITRYSDLAGTQPVVTTTYTYDNLNRLMDLRHNNGTTDVAFYEYEYDDASRISQIIDVDGTTDYTYDRRSQLTGADHTDPHSPDESYEYDANGNREESHIHGTGYDTNEDNRIVTDGIYTFRFDEAGNLTQRTDNSSGQIRAFNWDHRNRLAGVVDKHADGSLILVVTMTYDAFDRRVSRSIDVNVSGANEGALTTFIYDREDVLLDFLDSDGPGPNQRVLDIRYLHGSGIDQLLVQDSDPSGANWLLVDHLGSTRDLVDENGINLNHIQYDAFGNLILQSNSINHTRYAFTGREFDRQLGLHYFRARYFDSQIGRFLSSDPIGFKGGQLNLFAYVGNNPLNGKDPHGLAVTGTWEQFPVTISDVEFLSFSLAGFGKRRGPFGGKVQVATAFFAVSGTIQPRIRCSESCDGVVKREWILSPPAVNFSFAPIAVPFSVDLAKQAVKALCPPCAKALLVARIATLGGKAIEAAQPFIDAKKIAVIAALGDPSTYCRLNQGR